METNEWLTVIFIVLIGCFGLLAIIALDIAFIVRKLGKKR